MTRAERDAGMVAERLAGEKEGAVAKRNEVSRRTVRAVLQAAREDAPEDYAAAAAALRTRVLVRIDRLLEAGLERLGAGKLLQLEPERLARTLADLARVRRDMAAAPVPGAGEHPGPRTAREPQAVMPVLSEAEWATEHPQ